MWRTALTLAAVLWVSAAAQAKWKAPVVRTADRPPPPAPEVPPADPALPIPLYHDRPEVGESIHSWWQPRRPPGFSPLLSDPLLFDLLVLPAGGGPPNAGSHRTTPFLRALHRLAEKRGWDVQEHGTERYRDGYAALLAGDDRCYVVAVVRGGTAAQPATPPQCLLLLDGDGRLLDRLSWGIQVRPSRPQGPAKGPGELRTWVQQAPTAAGDQLVLSCEPEPPDGGFESAYWGHAVTHQGRTYFFSWDRRVAENRNAAVREYERLCWVLCRVAVREGKFVVLFPKLEQPASSR
jgi:hypothetical protein